MKERVTDGYAWVIVVSSFFTLFFNASLCYSVGVLHMRLVETYPQNEYTVAWLGSTLTSMSSICAPIASLVINLFNCRTCAVLAGILGFVGFVGSCFARSLTWLFVTYGLTVGLGFGLSNATAVVILGYYFEKDTSLAAGIVVMGGGLGMFVHPALTDFLLNLYGLRGTFLLLGGVILQSCIFGMLMRPSKFEVRRQLLALSGQTRSQQIFHSICGGDTAQIYSIFQNIPFVLLVCSYFTISLAISSIYLYLPDYFVQSGASHQIASFSISVSGIGSIISRVLSGFAANDPQIGGLMLLAGMAGISGILVIFVNILSLTTAGQLVYGALLGLYTGGTWAICGPVTLELLGTQNLATGYGFILMAVGIAYLIGPPVAGLIFQASNQYYSVFLFCAVMFITSSGCSFLTAVTRDSRHKARQSDSSYGRKEKAADAMCNGTRLLQENGYDHDEKKTSVLPELEILVSVPMPDT